MALDPSGTTTLDAWQPSKEGDLLAYQLSEGGTEESVLRVMDVATGEHRRRPDRPRALLPRRVAAGRRGVLLRAPARPPSRCPTARSSSTAGSGCTASAPTPTTTSLVFGDGLRRHQLLRRRGQPRRPLAVRSPPPRAPSRATTSGSPTSRRRHPSKPDSSPCRSGVDAQTSLHFGRDGRVYVYTDLDAPRGRICVTEPGAWSLDHWRDLVPEDPDAVLEGWAILDGDELDRRPSCSSSRSQPRGRPRSPPRPRAPASETGAVPLPGLGTVAGISRAPRGRARGLVRLHRPHHAVVGLPLRRAHRRHHAVGQRRRARVDVPDVAPEQVTYTSTDGTDGADVRHLADRRDRAAPRPTILYGYGGFGVPLTPAYSATILAWVEAGGVYAVANLRGGGEEGEDWHRAGMRDTKQNVFDDFHAAAEWLVDARLDHAATSSPSPAARTAGCSSAPRSPSGPTSTPRSSARRRCSTWSATRSTARPDLDRRVRHGRRTPRSSAGCSAYSPYHHVREGVDYPATLFTVFDGDTRVDPLHARKMSAALQHATTGSRPVLLRRETDVGHGARAVTRAVELSVDTLAFAAAQTGLIWDA